MHVEKFTFNPFSTNCYVVVSRGKCAIIDPGCESEDELSEITGYIRTNSLEVEKLLLTHAHLDHIFGCKWISEQYGGSFALHHLDLPLFQNAEQQAKLFGLSLNLAGVETHMISEGDRISVGEASLSVRFTPGHSPGSVSFVDQSNKVLFCGDVLFNGSIGRTDLWGGTLPVLMKSITEVILPLGDEFRVYPGHGPETTIGHEATTNPFLPR